MSITKYSQKLANISKGSILKVAAKISKEIELNEEAKEERKAIKKQLETLTKDDKDAIDKEKALIEKDKKSLDKEFDNYKRKTRDAVTQKYSQIISKLDEEEKELIEATRTAQEEYESISALRVFARKKALEIYEELKEKKSLKQAEYKQAQKEYEDAKKATETDIENKKIELQEKHNELDEKYKELTNKAKELSEKAEESLQIYTNSTFCNNLQRILKVIGIDVTSDKEIIKAANEVLKTVDRNIVLDYIKEHPNSSQADISKASLDIKNDSLMNILGDLKKLNKIKDVCSEDGYTLYFCVERKECPNCGETHMFSGERCYSCGYRFIDKTEKTVSRRESLKTSHESKSDYTSQSAAEFNANVVLKTLSDMNNSFPKCPNCSSIMISRISTAERGVSVALWGAASGKIGKQYKCDVCHHMW